MVKPTPISLRIRAAEATDRARKLLSKLDEDARLRRRVRFLAVKALISIREMETDLQSMSASDRGRFEADCKLAKSTLQRISKTGV